ncbi:hypothetical protein BST81_17075 [Leptolyngbya sp. 'hensonii']|uniref:SPOR domain-containing protein n=1 Tax=Leptolyngbya sp. 'hensonii' TaxID=1922337 RepID=UPI00094FF5B9|nr:SPOR domain-containing protein [Leptolyngbya sp. 'hensonii']OLP17071.1 hypothetical protein BST81_17075 [Leptolyngbya sp. 'hensonii']
MSRPSSIASPENQVHTGSLHPILQAALSSLNINLDEELARYRRRRRSQQPVAAGASPFRVASKPIDLISIGTPSTPEPSQQQRGADRSEPVSPTISRPLTPTVISPTRSPLSNSSEEIVSAAPAASPEPLEERSVDAQPGMVLSTPPTQVGAIPEPALQPYSEVDLSEQADPYSYFESSEELLKTLSEEEGQMAASSGSGIRWLNPLGIGSVLLLLFSSAGVGYVAMNQVKLHQIGLNRKPQAAAPKVDQQPIKLPAVRSDSDGPTSIPNSPDLTAKEFVNLNLNTLGTLETNAVPNGTPPSSPTAAAASPQAQLKLKTTASTAAKTAASPKRQPGSTALPSVAPLNSSSIPFSDPPIVAVPTRSPIEAAQSLPPQPTVPRTVAPPAPAQIAPTRSRAAKPSRQAASTRPAGPPKSVTPSARQEAVPGQPIAPSQPGKYVVTTPFNGDQTLEQVKQAVPDAFVRNSPQGAQIQVGSFQDPAKAQEMVQTLQQQGINAEVKPR